MEKRPFIDEDTKLTEEKLENAMKDSYSNYTKLMGITDSFLKDWNFSKSSGWMLKVYNKNKALFYLIPLKNKFKISMAIRENERKIFLEDKDLKNIQDVIKSSKKYREGYALRFDIENDDDFKLIDSLIRKLITLRT